MVKMVLHSLCPLNLSLSHGQDDVTQYTSSVLSISLSHGQDGVTLPLSSQYLLPRTGWCYTTPVLSRSVSSSSRLYYTDLVLFYMSSLGSRWGHIASVLPMVKVGSHRLCPLNLSLSLDQDCVTTPLSSLSLSSPWSR
jgi:hypothetical protein